MKLIKTSFTLYTHKGSNVRGQFSFVNLNDGDNIINSLRLVLREEAHYWR